VYTVDPPGDAQTLPAPLTRKEQREAEVIATCRFAC